MNSHDTSRSDVVTEASDDSSGEAELPVLIPYLALRIGEQDIGHHPAYLTDGIAPSWISADDRQCAGC